MTTQSGTLSVHDDDDESREPTNVMENTKPGERKLATVSLKKCVL